METIIKDGNFTYENQGTSTFLVFELQEGQKIETMSLGMLTNNKIPGLAQTVFTQVDNRKYIKYNVSAKVSVSQFFSGVVNRKRLLGVFKGIINAVISAEEYMIDLSCLVLDLDYIYTDVSTCETILVCLPIENDDNKMVDVGGFCKNIVFGTQFDQTENCDYVAKIINYLNSATRFSFMDFKTILDNIDAEGGTVGCAKKETSVKPYVQQKQSVQPKVPKNNAPSGFETSNRETAAFLGRTEGVVPPSAQIPQNSTIIKEPIKSTSQMPVQETRKEPTRSNAQKGMSLFYLLQHYNKENAAIYKSQKNAKKSPKTFDQNGGPVKEKNPSPTNNAFNFAVPDNFNSAFPQTSAPQAPQQEPYVVKPTTLPQTPIQNSVVQKQNNPSQTSVAPQPIVLPKNQVVAGQAVNFGETTVLGGGVGETTVLTASSTIFKTTTAFLMRTKNNEKILLTKPVFRIGKEKSYVDYFIGDNSAISRSHANIISRDGEYFVVDTNSTNHTYVNGQMIQSNVETKIAHGTKIKLANEDFEFRLY